MKKLLYTTIISGTLFLYSCNDGTGTNTTTDTTTTTNALNDAEITDNTSGAASMIGAKDSDFAKDAAMSSMMEVELGNIALQNASSQDVKEFASMMVTDHSAANDRLKSIASQKNIALPMALSQEHQKEVQDLRTKTGADFDKMYVERMQKHHEMDIEKFKKASEELTDTDLKNFSTETLPTLQKHRDALKQISVK